MSTGHGNIFRPRIGPGYIFESEMARGPICADVTALKQGSVATTHFYVPDIIIAVGSVKNLSHFSFSGGSGHRSCVFWSRYTVSPTLALTVPVAPVRASGAIGVLSSASGNTVSG